MFDRRKVSLARKYQVPVSLHSMHEPHSMNTVIPSRGFGAKGSAFLPTDEKADLQAAPVLPFPEQPTGGLGMTVSEDSARRIHSRIPAIPSSFQKL